MASVNDDASDMGRVAKRHSSQCHVVIAQRDRQLHVLPFVRNHRRRPSGLSFRVRLVWNADVTVELVDSVVWLLDGQNCAAF